MGKLYQVTTDFGACAGVEVDENEKIIDTAPIFKQFIGQQLDNMRSWKRARSIIAVLAEAEVRTNESATRRTTSTSFWK